MPIKKKNKKKNVVLWFTNTNAYTDSFFPDSFAPQYESYTLIIGLKK